MKVTPIKTDIVHAQDNLFEILDRAIPQLSEKTVIAITSKVVALCEGNVVEKKIGNREEKQQIVRDDSDLYVDPSSSKYGVMLTIKDSILAVNGGVDESNADGYYVLLPKNSYGSAEKIWNYLRIKFGVTELGIIITDSRTIPLKWGVMGTCLAHCGFKALDNKIGEKDLFGYEMQMTQVNVAEALAVSAVFLMGESNEAQPVAVITELSESVQFQPTAPSGDEREALLIEPEDDVFAPLLLNAEWKKGK